MCFSSLTLYASICGCAYFFTSSYFLALLVRFITKRYIGEYMSGKRQSYDYSSPVGTPTGGDHSQQRVVFQDENSHKVRVAVVT